MIAMFYWILNMTILGSLLGAILFLLRRVKKIPRRFIYGFYSIIYIRLLCPFGLSNGFSFLNLLPKGAVRLVNVPSGTPNEWNYELSLSNFMQKAESYEPLVLKSSGVTRFFEIASILWLLGSTILFLGYSIMYFLATKEIKKAELLHDHIYQSKAVNVPMVVGIIKPKIILPVHIKESAGHVKHLIAHEETHIRRRDNLWRLLAIFTTCIHWFNPLVWIILNHFFMDMELACDEKTIHKYNATERMDYAATILEFASKEPTIYATSFGGGNVKIRMKRVISFQKFTVFTYFIFISLFMILVVFFLSNK